MKIAIFGASGFVGSALLEQALKRNLSIKVLARDPERLVFQNDSAKTRQYSHRLHQG